MYGIIPSGNGACSMVGIEVGGFLQMLVDIYELVKPQLTIIDGIMAMEGEGPARGKQETWDFYSPAGMRLRWMLFVRNQRAEARRVLTTRMPEIEVGY